MSTPNRHGLDIEIILNDLYAREINASILWIWDGGFCVTLGDPRQAEGWALRSIGEAVAWLRDQAIGHYLESAFSRKYTEICSKYT
jgi:hypothetical protein